MAGTSIARALKRSAQLTARKVPKRTSTEVTVSDHILKARENFTYFCCAMGKPPAPHMLDWHRELVTGESNDHLMDVAGPNTCLLSPRGPLDLDTEVATPDGWLPMRHLQAGDQVFTSAGQVTTITDTVNYGQQPCWEVVFDDGTTAVCDDSHKWRVRRANCKEAPWRIRTLEALRRNPDGFCGVSAWLLLSGSPRWSVPVAEAVAYPEVDLPIDPYLLGILISRGSMVGSAVRFTCRDEDVVERVRQCLPDECRVHEVAGATRVWSVTGVPACEGRSGPRNPVLADLEELGLWRKSGDQRRIPELYLRAAIPQRIALLQGLMDGAGRPCSGGQILFSSVSQQVADGVLELARSLGGIAWRRAPRVNRTTTTSVIRFALPEQIEPFHGARKAARCAELMKTRRGSALSRRIVDIRPAGQREVGCLTVESPLHDFLLRDYVVSCNSAKSTEVGLLCSWLIGRHTLAKRLLRVLYVSFNIDVARGKSLAIKNTLQSAEYQEIFPMVRISKTRTSDELWSIDFDFAGIDVRGEDAFTLACAGLQGAITSKRSSLVILDDLIKSKKSISNPEVRREMEANWNSVIVPTMFQGARAVALGTRFHFDDMFATTFTERNGWKVLTQAALQYDDEGEVRSYWPEMWSLKYLLELQRKDRVSFAYQYMNQAVRSTELGVSPELFIKGQIPDSFDTIGVGLDLSAGLGERNDYTVFMLGGRDGDKAYIIDKRRVRCMGNIEKVEALCDLLHEWNLLGRDETGRYLPTFSEVTIWPESVAYQKSFQGDFRRIVYDEWHLSNLRISPVKGIRGDKLARFRGVIGLFETQRVVFNKYRDFQVVFDEVMNLGHAAHDDCADALQILLDQLYKRGVPQVEWS